MRTIRISQLGLAAAVALLTLSFLPARTSGQTVSQGIRIDADDLGGVVTSSKGPEAGVWVIAETTELPTKYVKIVVTDDRGRYVLPDLPKANYSVWVRGYGLVDSPKVQSSPGKILNLTAVVAPSEAAAAEYYPAYFWYSMLKVPAANEFPGTGPDGNGIAPGMKTQSHWLANIKMHGCNSCHQIGNKATRTFPEPFSHFPSSVDAWARRVQSGQAAKTMIETLDRLGSRRALANFADWTDRIKAGELPAAKPARPQGVERNVVITQWDWAGAKDYLHDEIATDKRNPTVNAYGKLYGSPEDSTDLMPILDPVNNVASDEAVPMREEVSGMLTDRAGNSLPSPYWGEEKIWTSRTGTHNVMFDGTGRVWLTSRIRGAQTPDFCRQGSSHPSAKLFPIDRAGRQASIYDPKTGKFTLIDTCFTTHHLVFAEDANDTLWFSSGATPSGVVGWINTKKFDETGDEQASQGWTAFILDTNGNGKRDDYVEPNQPVDPAKDQRIRAGMYGIGFNPADGSIWGSVLAFPGGILRVAPGPNPPATALTEYFEVPFHDSRTSVSGYGPRGMDIDRNGVVSMPLASGHLATFDRRKCKGPLNGPTATGKHCPEGWTLYPFPGPQFQGVTESGSAMSSYYAWVDQFDTFGLGKNIPLVTGNTSDSLLALVNGKFVTLRIPYPMGFHAKGLDGRIDDPNGGWKTKGLWSTYAGRVPFHIEGGKGTKSKVVQFQLRPDPLAK